jgi:uncharacterized lipoprotein YajG
MLEKLRKVLSVIAVFALLSACAVNSNPLENQPQSNGTLTRTEESQVAYTLVSA